MTVLRVIARPLLASTFVVGGAAALKDPRARAEGAQPLANALGKVAPELPITPTNVVRANAAIHLVAGTALATGTFPRTAALALAATVPATTLAGHQFWAETDPVARKNQLNHFIKNLGLLGGLLMSTLDPDPHKKFIGTRAKNKVVDAKESVQAKLSS